MLTDLENSDLETVRRCLRDVVALSTLPAMWSGAHPSRIAESLAAALFTATNPDLVYVHLRGTDGATVAEVTQTGRYETHDELAKRLGKRVLDWARTHDPDDLLVLPDAVPGVDRLRISARSLGNDCEYGVIAAGFAEADQPSATSHLLLNIGAREAVTAIINARLLHSLRASEQRFRALVDASAQIVWTASADGAALEDSPSWREFTGQTHAQRKGYGWLNAIHPDDRERIAEMWRDAVASRTPVETEYRLRHVGGEWRWTAARAVPLFASSGELVEWVGMNTDITVRKLAQETQQLLLAELNHRVKNTLANVQAIAQQTLRRAQSPGEFVASFSGRLQALSRVHSQLTDATWKGADLGALIHDQLQQISREEGRVRTAGPTITLPPQIALHMALVLHELGTNSCKYGALSNAEGEVSITWSIRSDVLRLNWVERSATAVSAPSRKGFGTTLIEGGLKTLGGEAQVTYRATGVSWEISLPLQKMQPGERRSSSRSRGAEAGVDRAANQGAEAVPLAGKRVLVVEDEVLVAFDIVAVLEDLQVEPVGPVHTIEDACRLIDKGRLDAALLDANLHGMGVGDLAAALTRCGTPFAFVTGYRRDSLPAAFRSAPIIAKPFKGEDIAAALQRLLLRNEENTIPLRGREAGAKGAD